MAKKYSPDEISEFKEKIIDKLWEGKSLRRILREDDSLPNRKYVYEWLNPNNERFDADFSNHYAHVREESADYYFDLMEQIRIKMLKGKYEPAQARVAIQELQWKAGRMKPRKYGDKLDLTTGGKELQQQVTIYELPNNNRDNNSKVIRNIIGVDEDGKAIYEDAKEGGEK